MTDRIPLDHLTSDDLDRLYEQLARAQRVAMHALDQHPPATDPGLRRQHAAAIRALGASETQLAGLRATLARVQAIADEHPAGIDTALIWEALDDTHHPLTEANTQRVIALYERWVKAGPPPLGVPLSRWWDQRLAELRDAINPKDQPHA